MKKQDERPAEEIAKDLEDLDFADIGADDLKDIFGGATARQDVPIDINCNCCC